MAGTFNTGLSEAQISNAFSRALGDYTDAQIDAKLAQKQDTIADLADIRSGAEAGATAVQPADLAAETSAREAADSVMQAEIDGKADASELHAFLPNITASTTIQDYVNSLSKGVYTAFIANVSNPPDSPINANCFVNIYIFSATTAAVELIPISTAEMPRTYTMRKIGGTWRGWYMHEGTPVASSTQSTASLMSTMPEKRAEITAEGEPEEEVR